jgi:hypothetical protein
MSAGTWLAYDDGNTIGLQGVQGGTIIRDELYNEGARITLERDCLRVPYAITTSIYGLGDHTRFIADEPSAMHAYDVMRGEVAEIADLMPGDQESDEAETFDAAQLAFDAFSARYP